MFARLLPDDVYLKWIFPARVGYPLDLKNPKTFNEKLQWLKLYDRRPIYTTMVDKYAVKKYVADIIGEEYIIPTLGVWDRPEDIEWDKLPNQFVLKCTHDSGGLVICHKKSDLDIESATRKLKNSLNTNFFLAAREWPYKDVPARIIAEQYMVDESGYELKDYKFFCFDGKPQYVQVDFDRFMEHKRNIYDMQWAFINLQIEYPNDPNRIIEKPLNFEKMKEIASVLSEGVPHVRVDLYNVNGHIYFGELTFFHGSGFEHFVPREWDKNLGALINLPEQSGGGML